MLKRTRRTKFSEADEIVLTDEQQGLVDNDILTDSADDDTDSDVPLPEFPSSRGQSRMSRGRKHQKFTDYLFYYKFSFLVVTSHISPFHFFQLPRTLERVLNLQQKHACCHTAAFISHTFSVFLLWLCVYFS